MSDFVGWWEPTGHTAGADATARVATALEPVAVDGLDAHRDRAAGIELLHARFETVPEAGHERQPLSSADGHTLLVASARLDNLDELRSRLPGDLRTATDAQTLLAAYDRWGEEAVHHLRGDFAFVAWDARRKQLFGARDHLGVRPLYLARTRPGAIVFGTSLAGVVAHPDVARGLDRQHLEQVLRTDIWDVTRTPWSAVRRLPPGHRFTVARDLRPRVRTYWSLTRAKRVRDATPEDEREFRRVFEDAVRTRTRRHGRLALQVSGGLDSSMVVAVAARDDPDALGVTFTLPGSAQDERELAAAVARRAVIEHRTFAVGAPAPPAATGRLTSMLRQPPLAVAGQAELDMFAAVRAAGCRVVLTGHGGDQLFAPSAAHVVELLRSPRALSGHHLPAGLYGGPRWRHALARDLYAALVPGPPRQAVRGLRQRLAGAVDPVDRALPTDRRPSAPVRSLTDRLWAESLLNGHSQLTAEQSRAHLASHGIEERHPFMDVRLVELSSQVRFTPSPGGPYRDAQRRVGRGLLPPEVVVRRVNADYTEQNRVRCRSFDPAVAALRHVEAAGLARSPEHLRSVVAHVLDDRFDVGAGEVWATLAALAVETWLRTEAGGTDGAHDGA